MAFAYALDPTTPGDGESAKLGAGRIRDVKNALIERIESWFVSVDTDPWVAKSPASGGNVRTLTPAADNAYVLGTAALRWADIRSALATIATAVITTISGTTATYTSFVGALTGNASTATALQTARTINGVAFNGTANITISAGTVGTLTFGTHLTSGDASFGGSNATITSDATDAATASTIVARDASKGFSAGTILPDADNTRNLGSALLRYAQVFTVLVNGQTISSAASFTGTLAVSGTSTFAGVIGASFTTNNDASRFLLRNTAVATVGHISTVKDWIASGVNVTDLAIAAGGTMNFYASGSTTSSMSLTSSTLSVLAIVVNGTGTTSLVLNAPATTNQSLIYFRQATTNRWEMGTAPNATPSFGIYSYGLAQNVLSLDYTNGQTSLLSLSLSQSYTQSVSSNSAYETYSSRNTSNGTGAANRTRLGNDQSANAFTIDVYSSTHIAGANIVKIYNQNNAVLELGGYGTTGLTLGNGGAATFAAGIATAATGGGLGSTGIWKLGQAFVSAPGAASRVLSVQVDGANYQVFAIPG